MSENKRRRRADADRNTTAILTAAASVLADRPHASIDEIATEAGVSRQTVYAHYTNRDALLAALVEYVSGQVVADLDRADLDDGPAIDALRRLLDTAWAAFDHTPLLLTTATGLTAEQSDHAHEPVVDRLRRLIRRGRDTGEFTTDLDTDWLVTATLALGHAAGDSARTGGLARARAVDTLHRTLLALYRA